MITPKKRSSLSIVALTGIDPGMHTGPRSRCRRPMKTIVTPVEPTMS